jgi:peptidyl-tRNA hydrolase
MPGVTEPLIHYCVVREDLPVGVAAAQLVHAAGESFYHYGSGDKFGPSNVSGTIAVVLAVPDEMALLQLENRLRMDDVRFVAIREPDAPWNGQLMTIGVLPGSRDRLAPLFTAYPLYARPSLGTTLKALFS